MLFKTWKLALIQNTDGKTHGDCSQEQLSSTVAFQENYEVELWYFVNIILYYQVNLLASGFKSMKRIRKKRWRRRCMKSRTLTRTRFSAKQPVPTEARFARWRVSVPSREAAAAVRAGNQLTADGGAIQPNTSYLADLIWQCKVSVQACEKITKVVRVIGIFRRRLIVQSENICDILSSGMLRKFFVFQVLSVSVVKIVHQAFT